MKKLKKILSMFVASAAMITTISSFGSMSSSAASARKTVTINGLNREKFHLEYMDYGYNQVIITGCGQFDKHIVIPAKINGKNVVAIKENAFSIAVNSLEGVVIGPNVTTVGKKGFGVNMWGTNNWLSDGISIDNKNIKIDGYYNGQFPTAKLYLNNAYGDSFTQGYSQFYQTFKRGDMDGDGRVDVEDATSILEYATESSAENATWDIGKMAIADVDRDGNVTSKDAQLALEYYVGYVLMGSSTSFEQVLRNKGL